MSYHIEVAHESPNKYPNNRFPWKSLRKSLLNSPIDSILTRNLCMISFKKSKYLLPESSTRYYHRMRQVKQGVKLWVDLNFISDFSAQHLPSRIEVGHEVGKIDIWDFVDQFRSSDPITWNPIFHLIFHREVVIHKLNDGRLGGLFIFFSHQFLVGKLDFSWTIPQFHVHKSFGVLKNSSHLDHVKYGVFFSILTEYVPKTRFQTRS